MQGGRGHEADQQAENGENDKQLKQGKAALPVQSVRGLHRRFVWGRLTSPPAPAGFVRRSLVWAGAAPRLECTERSNR